MRLVPLDTLRIIFLNILKTKNNLKRHLDIDKVYKRVQASHYIYIHRVKILQPTADKTVHHMAVNRAMVRSTL